MSHRLSVNVSDQTAFTVRRFSVSRGTTVTDTVRRAIAVLDFLEQEIAAGNSLQSVTSDGTIRLLTII